MAETLPVYDELSAFIDTDNVWDFVVTDENGARLDVALWTADFEIAEHVAAVPKLSVAAAPTTDPLDVTKNVLRVTVTDDQLQPGSAANQWILADYVYSLKRTNAGVEKILRYGPLHMLRARK